METTTEGEAAPRDEGAGERAPKRTSPSPEPAPPAPAPAPAREAAPAPRSAEPAPAAGSAEGAGAPAADAVGAAAAVPAAAGPAAAPGATGPATGSGPGVAPDGVALTGADAPAAALGAAATGPRAEAAYAGTADAPPAEDGAQGTGSGTVDAPQGTGSGTVDPQGADDSTSDPQGTHDSTVDAPQGAGDGAVGPQGAGDGVAGPDGASGRGEGVARRPGSLSPSRAGDFMQCPLLYRFRVIDRLPEKPSEAATRGTLVHAVLERLFDAPAAERTAPRAKALIPGQWDRLRESRPELLELFADDADGERLARWLTEAERLVERWFTLEDPTRLEPAERELFVEAELESGLRLRGIIDRVDVAPTGEVRIVDYKTGKAPRPEYAEGALFQMKFYALVVWRLKNVVPRRLQLVYLGSGDVLTYDPVLADLERVERKLLALWEAIRLATETGDWRPRPTKLCGWCDHRAHCPEFGGTPPPYPLPLTRAT
ncbi:hypothetical protein GCM10010508_63750 [Streptomyces naganishii JCM 4654]|uniref:PD-(D/E)XK endonuclease-like domain-containing protein n=2 Tax=Streptomyces naganishii TaxID=285447 RepID=A0A919D0C2_9ACTN|nr:hypothetical protein GCM10010508_63750 [Streptomyces naganishii JCM 4654]